MTGPGMGMRETSVVKTDGGLTPFDREYLRRQLLERGLSRGLEEAQLMDLLAKICAGLPSEISSTDLVDYIAGMAADLVVVHPQFSFLASSFLMDKIYKTVPPTFSAACDVLWNRRDDNGIESPFITHAVREFVLKHGRELDAMIKSENDYGYNYFGLKTLLKSYLIHVSGKLVETPQYMLMRVAVALNTDDMEMVKQTYWALSERFYTHATPTLANAGIPNGQLSSCFLLTVREDSIEGIYRSITECALVSKGGGGVGINVTPVRASGSKIMGTGGISNGIVPMLKVFEQTAKYVDQGGNKRPGAFAVYLEPWHADVFEFLELRKTGGSEDNKARGLFQGLWIPDLFMKRVIENGDWALFCPTQAPRLMETWGDEFEKEYERYVAQGAARKVIKARKLWNAILEARTETGNPYMMYKDACNRKSNQQHLGIIDCANLCTEVIQFKKRDEIAVCNLASLNLSAFFHPEIGFDFALFRRVIHIVVKNLDRLIDLTSYPSEGARKNNLTHRPMGIGVQGLADLFVMLDMAYDSEEAARLNRDIFEAKYFCALEASKDLAAIHGPYPSYHGSQIQKGIYQYDYYPGGRTVLSNRWDWEGLRAEIAYKGIRNSLLIAPMPTASTAQVMGNNEAFEPFTSNIFSRRVLSGEFQVVNHHLVKKLIPLGLWSKAMSERIIAEDGSIQAIKEIPANIRAMFKTVWEISQKVIIDMAADRARFICQSQSLNLFIETPTTAKLNAMFMRVWEKGLKGDYYLRTRPAAGNVKNTINPSTSPSTSPDTPIICTREDSSCDSCGS